MFSVAVLPYSKQILSYRGPIQGLTFLAQIGICQFFVDYYPQGKTSTESRFNIPGKIGWATMEAPGFITLLYIMYTLPKENGIDSLPRENWVMAGLFVRDTLCL